MTIKLRFLYIPTKAPDLAIRKEPPIMVADHYVDLPIVIPNTRLIRTGQAIALSRIAIFISLFYRVMESFLFFILCSVIHKKRD